MEHRNVDRHGWDPGGALSTERGPADLPEPVTSGERETPAGSFAATGQEAPVSVAEIFETRVRRDPSLRLGWIVPESLGKTLSQLKHGCDLHVLTSAWQAATRFFDGGHFPAHPETVRGVAALGQLLSN